MITLDTSALLAILNAGDRYHSQITAALRGDSGPYIVPAGILSELAYMVETRYGLHALDYFSRIANAVRIPLTAKEPTYHVFACLSGAVRIFPSALRMLQ